MEAAGASISRIVLHGSRVYGRARPSSDFDILVVMRHEVGDWVAESVRLSELFVDHDQPVDIQVFGKEEFEECRPVPATIAYLADQDGLVLYDDRFPLEEEILAELPAITRRLAGIAVGGPDEEGFRAYLLEKYSRSVPLN